MNQPIVKVQDTSASQQPAQAPMHHPAPAVHHAGRQSRTWLPWAILGAVVIIALIVIGVVFRSKLFPTTANAEKLSGYQAVFLTNGQVYFGKISNTDEQYVHLTNIYYLQVNQALQTANGTSAAAAAAAAANQSTQLSLVKLGNELHGPSDEMNINRDQILFYEDLKQAGQVAQAIQKYQQSGGTAGAANSNPAQGTQQAPASNATTAPKQ